MAKKINILVNFSALKAGGGQNVGLNFISQISEVKDDDIRLFFWAAKGSQIHIKLKSDKKNRVIGFPNNPIFRIIKELIWGFFYIKKNNIDVIYSYFGYSLIFSNIPQVVGAADSNLMYPDVNFWQGYTGISLLKKKIVDKYRIFGLFKASGVIFENGDLEERFHSVYKKEKLTTTILPSIVKEYEESVVEFEISDKRKKGLFLCGWHLNKNVLLIPEIAFELKKRAVPFQFIITAPKDKSKIYKKFVDKMKWYDVESMISIIGQVKKEQLKSLYNQVDFIFLLSLLESFSNNIIEAWTYKKLLVITDASWSKAVCKDAAIYVNRNSAEHIAESVQRLICNTSLVNTVIENAEGVLNNFPSIADKTKQELDFIKKVYGKH